MQDVSFFSVLSGSPLYLLVLFSLGFWLKEETQFKLSVSYIWHCSAELKVWFSIKYLLRNKFSHKNSHESCLHSFRKTWLIGFIAEENLVFPVIQEPTDQSYSSDRGQDKITKDFLTLLSQKAISTKSKQQLLAKKLLKTSLWSTGTGSHSSKKLTAKQTPQLFQGLKVAIY